MDLDKVPELILRYGLLVILGLGNLIFFYMILTPLTVYASYFLLNILYDATLYNFQNVLNPGNVIFFKGFFANIIPACVAGAAYYFLLMLNLTTPMPLKKRIFSLLFTFVLFYIINVTRIVVFGVLLYQGYQYFDLTHQLTWYVGSTLMVIAIWFVNVKIFKIKEIPIYTDLKTIFSDIYSRKSKTSK